MDCEELIASVYARPSLWDQMNRNYHSRDISRNLWSEVANEMKCSSEAAKTKWRGLRDTFRKEVQKELKRHCEEGGMKGRKSTWQYYDSMHFLRKQFTLRKLPDVAETDSNNDVDTDFNHEFLTNAKVKLEANEDEEEEEESEPMTITIEPASITTLVNPHDILTTNTAANRLKKETYRKLLAIKESKKRKEIMSQKQRNDVSSVESSRIVEDSDYHFLISLLPYLRNVSSDRKMTVRTRIQQVFCEEERIARRKLKHHENYVEPSYSSSRGRDRLSRSSSRSSSSNDAYDLQIVTE